MRAAPGAIERVRIADDAIEVDAIDNAEPVGICGSGLVDAVAELVRTGLVTPNGRLLWQEEAEQAVPAHADRIIPDQTGGAIVLYGSANDPDSAIKLHAQDIRQLQLARGASAAG